MSPPERNRLDLFEASAAWAQLSPSLLRSHVRDHEVALDLSFVWQVACKRKRAIRGLLTLWLHGTSERLPRGLLF